jgi:hypothetical protein
MFELDVVPQSWMPYVQLGLIYGVPFESIGLLFPAKYQEDSLLVPTVGLALVVTLCLDTPCRYLHSFCYAGAVEAEHVVLLSLISSLSQARRSLRFNRREIRRKSILMSLPLACGRCRHSLTALFQRVDPCNVKLKTKLHGLSPRANCTDRATAACRQSYCQLLRIDGATWSAWRIPTAVFSVL